VLTACHVAIYDLALLIRAAVCAFVPATVGATYGLKQVQSETLEKMLMSDTERSRYHEEYRGAD
jgi:hypothetical protein